MKEGIIYTQEKLGSMQDIWAQFHYDTSSVVWSDDGGLNWNEVPSMDTGKWALTTVVEGKIIYWIFKIKDSY